jgi:hypothetical protein
MTKSEKQARGSAQYKVRVTGILINSAERAHTAKTLRARKKWQSHFLVVATHNPDVICAVVTNLYDHLEHAEAVRAVKADLQSRGLEVRDVEAANAHD